ncbi:MAG TPA: 4Fe-4S dicluster domain-containing protein [Bacteroidales bacterium]|nr:4Fe-4S dicluster domain-containing protein [Bacteroidales bacterium]
MKSHHLRTLRIIVAGLFFVSLFLIFVDLRSLIPAKYIQGLLYIQFVPSLLKYLNTAIIAVSSGFVLVLILTLLSGRTYCSFICPMGIGQDIFSRIGGRVKKRFRRFGYRKADNILRYIVLITAVGVTIIWGIYVLTVLDPFSIFGRFMTFLGKPVFVSINNFLSGILGKAGIYTLAHTQHRPFTLVMYSLPVLFFLISGIMAFTKGRLYCNTICPVGTLLGFVSKFSLLRINFDDSLCTRCGRCSMRCKSSCIDSINRKFDVSRCVGCFNCVNVCQEDAISYSLVKFRRLKEPKTDESRRKIIVGSVMFLLGMRTFGATQDKKAPKPKQASTIMEQRNYPVCPPGGISIEHFNTTCTACSLCISECPNGVLQPAFREYGLVGLMQPVMNYSKSFCSYKCTICTEICPSYALQPLKPEAKQLTQIGKARFIKDNCIVKTERTNCGACSESCPTKAVYMIPFEGNLLIPAVNDEICVGCGHCEYSCPTSPYKAIYVDGNPVHIAALKPENSRPDIPALTEFPF